MDNNIPKNVEDMINQFKKSVDYTKNKIAFAEKKKIYLDEEIKFDYILLQIYENEIKKLKDKYDITNILKR